MGIARRALEALRPHRRELLDLLESIVTINSHTADPDGVDGVAAVVLGQLEPLGFASRRSDPRGPVPGREWLEEILSPGMPVDRTGASFHANRPGVGLSVLLLGDLDTAFPADQVEQEFAVKGGFVYGPGVADMKGGLVVMVAALRALAALGVPSPAVTIVLSGDEQAGSLSSSSLILDEARSADLAFCLECARDGGKVMAARAQVGVGRLLATGQEAYTGHDRESGSNAIDLLVEALGRVRSRTSLDNGLVTATLIRGGRRRSVVPARAEAVLDIRAADAETWQRLDEAIAAAVLDGVAEADAIEWRAHAHRPAIPWTRATDEVLARVRVIASDAGVSLEALRSMAAGSSAFAGAAGIPTLDGLGPTGFDLMTRHERIEIGSIVVRAAVLAGILADVAASPAAWPAKRIG